MQEPEFNLIDEQWIKVMMRDGSEQEFSIKEVFGHAHEIVALAGETPLQDIAVLRFLIALNVTVLYRYDIVTGADSVLTDRKHALERFQNIWDNGQFPRIPFDTYFDKWYGRFYLSGGNRPFYQVPDDCWHWEDNPKKKGDKFVCVKPYRDSDKLGLVGAAAINGEILESANSPSVFAGRHGISKDTLSLSEAARWLIHYMAFADCSSKIPGKWNAGMTFPSSGANIHPVGKNLFQTIMLCSCLVDSNKNVYKNILPSWENDEYTEINSAPYGDGFPDNLPELYTQQSRKIVLVKEDKRITGAFVAAGERYGNVNAYIEPMFAFHIDKTDKSGMTYRPNHIKDGVDEWKEFKNIFGAGSANVTRWISILFDNDILSDDTNIPFQITDIGYGGMSCGVDYIYNSTLTVNWKFFEDSDEMQTAQNEIDHINNISWTLEKLGRNIELAMGKSKNQPERLSDELRKKYEKSIGNSFNCYLTHKVLLDKLRQDEIKFAYNTADECLDNLPNKILLGHGENTVGNAENIFRAEMYKIKSELGLVERKDKNV